MIYYIMIETMQACKLLNEQAPAAAAPPSAAKKSSSRKPLQLLPKSLVHQIQLQKNNQDNIQRGGASSDEKGGDANNNNNNKLFVPGRVTLKDMKRSDSSKWMRPKGQSPEKRDMKSHLEKSLGNMRSVQWHNILKSKYMYT
jgi:hypothetical protein